MTNDEAQTVIDYCENTAARMDGENHRVAEAYRDCAAQLRRFMPAETVKAEELEPLPEPPPLPKPKKSKAKAKVKSAFGLNEDD